MSSPVETIKERLSIADVVGSYMKLEKSGANLKAKCPFHNEKTPSFFVSPTRGSYYCFGCGAKGDMFSFIQAFEGLDFAGALKMLAARAGVEVIPEDPRVKNERERLFGVLEVATLFYQMQLGKEKDAEMYIKKRGLNESTISSWRLGYAPDSWKLCLEHCKQKGFSDLELEKAGLTKTEGGKTYDRFRGRIMFPIFDSSGRVVAFSGRLIQEREHAPKYLNSPETPVFSKSKILYGFHIAKNEIRRKDYAILVEGQMDLLMSHQAGFTNTVASSGTAFTQEHIILLKRLSKRILMVFDADKAGVQASVRSAALALKEGMEVKVAALPSGTDPAELIVSNKKDFMKSLKSSSHIIDFYLASIVREKLESRSLVRAIRERLLPYVASLESRIEQDHFVHKIAEAVGIREEALREDMPKTTVSPKAVSQENKESSLNPRKHLVERLIMGLWLWQKEQTPQRMDVEYFGQELSRILGKERAERLLIDAKSLSDDLIYQAQVYYGDLASLTGAAQDLLYALEEDVLREGLALAMKELSTAEKNNNAGKKNELLKKCNEITKRLEEIKVSR